jgi:Fe-S oxidoreductase
MFDRSKCDLCGDCFVRCSYVDYDRKEAVREISSLIEGENAQVLGECVTCVACNEYCEKGAKPFDLINGLQEKFGTLPIPERMVDWFDKLSSMPSMIAQGDPQKPALSICTMEPTLPSGTLESKIFEDMTVAKGGNFFCYIGEVHIGKEKPIRENAQRFVDSIANLGHKEVVFIHDDCYAMLAKVQEYGIKLPFRPIHIIEYLLSYLKEHEDKIVKLNKKIAYQRPCASRYTPEKEPMLDELFQIIGIDRMARIYDRESALCCGGVFTRILPEKVRRFQDMNMEDAKGNGAEAMVFLCPICHMNLGKICHEHEIQPVFITDLCRMAVGEIPISF